MKEIPIPDRIAALPKDDKGRPVPYFVQWPNGVPDFRLIDPAKLASCYLDNRCWVCGDIIGVHKAFVLGPMCCINRVNSEPPSHYGCARFSVSACPFLSTPRMHRRETDLPTELLQEPAVIALYHNPGASAIWVTKTYKPFSDGQSGFLFRLGPPERVEWYALGEPANRSQVMEAIEKGYPKLMSLAEMDGPLAVRNLQKQYEAMLPLLPQE
jgi:hypothetical protein